jgi:hypothetical protein
MMRTTITLDPDVARDVERRMAEDGRSFKQVVNEGLRRGLASGVREAPARYEVAIFDSPIEPGIDLTKVNQLLDEEPPKPVAHG